MKFARIEKCRFFFSLLKTGRGGMMGVEWGGGIPGQFYSKIRCTNKMVGGTEGIPQAKISSR